MEDEVIFYSGDRMIFGTLCLPDSSNALPAVVLSHGYGASRDEFGNFSLLAKKLGREGIGSLRFDHSGCGKSENQLGRIIACQQTEDIISAVSYLAGFPGIDSARVGALGESMGGANVLQAASSDSRICCVVSMSPVADGYQWIKDNWVSNRGEEAFRGFIKEVEADRARQAHYGRSNLVPMGYALSYPQRYLDLIDQIGESFTPRKFTYYIELASIDSVFGRKPVDDVAGISPRPLLLMAGKKDGAVPYRKNAGLLYDRAGDIKRLELFEEGDHGLLEGPVKQKALDIIIGWFKKYLIDGR
ncbi:MAG: alpha/beta hydrolase [Actinomycetota bacterium]